VREDITADIPPTVDNQETSHTALDPTRIELQQRHVHRRSQASMTRSSRGSSTTGASAAQVIALHRPTSGPPSSTCRERRRAVAYIRESTEEQGRGYSPDGQRQAIARYAEDYGLELIDE
jgi:hypothetical protein